MQTRTKTNNQILIQINAGIKKSSTYHGGYSMKFLLIYRVKTERLESVKIEDLLLNPATEETETPCSYSNRSLTLPQATGKMSMCAWEGLCIYVYAWVAGMCVFLFVSVSLTDGQETLTGLFALSVFWSLDQIAHHLTAMAVGRTLARTHSNSQAFTHACTHFLQSHVHVHTSAQCGHIHSHILYRGTHRVTQTAAGTEED